MIAAFQCGNESCPMIRELKGGPETNLLRERKFTGSVVVEGLPK